MDELKKDDLYIVLKPCPFCGEAPRFVRQPSFVKDGTVCHIICRNEKCGADFWFCGNEENEAEVIKRFNRREV